jgi:hypothetical protein
LSSPPQQPEKKTYRGMMESVPGSGKEHFADALSTVDAKNLHARARIPAVFAMATHNTLGPYVRKERGFTNNQNVQFNMATLSGLMACWDFEYEAISISLDGKGREEVRDVLKLAAIGSADESGALATSVLNEGSKNLSGKSSKTS